LTADGGILGKLFASQDYNGNSLPTNETGCSARPALDPALDRRFLIN
jgi:hypothetical protein